jgi:hypothetical protein
MSVEFLAAVAFTLGAMVIGAQIVIGLYLLRSKS